MPPTRRTAAHYSAALRWIQERASDAHHPQLQEFIQAFCGGNPSGWGDALYRELHGRSWVRPNQFGALRLIDIGKETYRRGCEG
jgi:hypothetical protein